jgi:hypothetical protein
VRKCVVGERIQLPTGGGCFNGCHFGWGSGTRGGGTAMGRRQVLFEVEEEQRGGLCRVMVIWPR